MKKLLLALAVVMMFSAVACAAAEPGYLMTPCETDPFFPNASNGCNLVNTPECLRVISTEDLLEGKNGDPYFMVNQELDSKYEWIKFRIKNLSEATMFEFHFSSTATEDKITAATCTHFPISSGDTEYKEYIYNIKEQTHELSRYRLDRV